MVIELNTDYSYCIVANFDAEKDPYMRVHKQILQRSKKTKKILKGHLSCISRYSCY